MDAVRVAGNGQRKLPQKRIKALGILIRKAVKPAVGACEIIDKSLILRILQTVEVILPAGPEYIVLRAVTGIFQPPGLLVLSIPDNDTICIISTGIRCLLHADSPVIMGQRILRVLFDPGNKAFRRRGRGESLRSIQCRIGNGHMHCLINIKMQSEIICCPGGHLLSSGIEPVLIVFIPERLLQEFRKPFGVLQKIRKCKEPAILCSIDRCMETHGFLLPESGFHLRLQNAVKHTVRPGHIRDAGNIPVTEPVRPSGICRGQGSILRKKLLRSGFHVFFCPCIRFGQNPGKHFGNLPIRGKLRVSSVDADSLFRNHRGQFPEHGPHGIVLPRRSIALRTADRRIRFLCPSGPGNAPVKKQSADQNDSACKNHSSDSFHTRPPSMLLFFRYAADHCLT